MRFWLAVGYGLLAGLSGCATTEVSPALPPAGGAVDALEETPPRTPAEEPVEAPAELLVVPPDAKAMGSTHKVAPTAVVREAQLQPEPPITAESVMAWVEAMPGDRSLGRPGHVQGREWIVDQLTQMGLSPEVQPFQWEGAPDADLANIEWVLPGTEAEAPLIVVCAHYDTVPYSGGADDNGSGVAVLLELARRSAGRSLPAEIRLLWFDAEEVGLAGSRAWVDRLDLADRQRLSGAINLETVGFVDRRPRSQWMPPGSDVLLDPGDVGDFLLIIANQGSADLAAIVDMGLRAEAGEALRVELFDRLPGVGWVMPDSRRSDHASFWDQQLPAVMLSDTANFRNPNYHRASDLPSTLDGEFLAAVGRGVERALLILAADW